MPQPAEQFCRELRGECAYIDNIAMTVNEWLSGGEECHKWECVEQVTNNPIGLLATKKSYQLCNKLSAIDYLGLDHLPNVDSTNRLINQLSVDSGDSVNDS